VDVITTGDKLLTIYIWGAHLMHQTAHATSGCIVCVALRAAQYAARWCNICGFSTKMSQVGAAVPIAHHQLLATNSDSSN
jgi:hypothetical protein